MKQVDIEKYLKGVHVENKQEIEVFFQDIQRQYLLNGFNKEFVVDYVMNNYNFDSHFSKTVVLVATLYVN